MTLGERIKNRLQELDRSPTWLAHVTGIPRPTIYEILRGDQATSTRTATIAQALGLRARWLEAEEGRRLDNERGGTAHLHVAEPHGTYDVVEGVSTRRVPLVSWVAASSFTDAADPYQPGHGDKFVLAFNVSERAFALRVRGPSMEPEFRDGAIIIVEPGVAASSGDFVVVRLNDANEATFKQLFVEGGVQWLRPLNPQFPALKIDGDAEICGVVKQQTREY